ncbi:hypothetical protein DOY81_013436 [Sarcophaga bullata]|nr:hypothetical protein DOY81_013436 [Sarcophaga bullata]
MKDIIKKIVGLDLSSSTSSTATDVSSSLTVAEPIKPGDISAQSEGNLVPNINYIENTLNGLSNTANYSNISITDSSNVHLGHKINYNGDVNLNLVNNSNNETGISLIQHNSDSNEVLINTVPNIYISSCTILPRSFWSIKIPKEEYNKIKEPVKLVLIQPPLVLIVKHIQLIRDIQSFHVDTQGWNDIAYNFLIGSDGNIYEGRGWGVEGAHTFSFNNRSIGISFIGCFINKMPTKEALNACKKLLKRGVDEGHLSKNYKLFGHRQCSPTESPGRKLFEEIVKWDHFYDKSIDEDLLSDND